MKSRPSSEHDARGVASHSRELRGLYTATIHTAATGGSRLRHGDGPEAPVAAPEHPHGGRVQRPRSSEALADARVEEPPPRRGGAHGTRGSVGGHSSGHSEVPSSAGSSRRSSGDELHVEAVGKAVGRGNGPAPAARPSGAAAAGSASTSKRGRGGGGARGGAGGGRGRARKKNGDDETDDSPPTSSSDDDATESTSARRAKKPRRETPASSVAGSSVGPAMSGRRSRRGDDAAEAASGIASGLSALSAAVDFAPEPMMRPKIRPRPIDVNRKLHLEYLEDADPTDRLEYYTFQEAGATSTGLPVIVERAREITCPDFVENVHDFEQLNATRHYIAHEQQRFCLFHPPGEGEVVEYDMDEEDAAFLDALPGNAGRKRLSETAFEQLVDAFERASHHGRLFEEDPASVKYQPQRTSHSSVPCQVCNDNENHEGNVIVACCSCGVSVHQTCYGISEDVDPAQKWTCDRCGLAEPEKVECAMCSVKDGAFKETTNPGEYAHVLCALWFPEARFVNPEKMQPIEINQRAFQRRKRLGTCSICNVSAGVCLNCCEKPCREVFHAMCARQKGLLMTMTEREEGVNQVLFRAYCELHTKEKQREKSGMESKERPPPTRMKLGDPISLVIAQKLPLPVAVSEQHLPAVYEHWIRKRQALKCSLLRRFQPCKAFQYLPGEKRGQTVRSQTSFLPDVDPHAQPPRNAAGRFVSMGASDGRSPTPTTYTRRGRGQPAEDGEEGRTKNPLRGRRRAPPEGGEPHAPALGEEVPDEGEEDEGASVGTGFVIRTKEDYADARTLRKTWERERLLLDLLLQREKRKREMAQIVSRAAFQMSEESERTIRACKRRIAQESG